MLLCLGFSYGSSLLRKHAYSDSERIILELKIAQFAHQELNLKHIASTFENELKGKNVPKKMDLPFFDKKKTYGPYSSFNEAKIFIDEKKERFPCKWFGVKYDKGRYKCTSAVHKTLDSKKLIQKYSQAKPLVFLVYFTTIYKNKNTSRWHAKDEKKYFHMLSDCVSNLGSDFITFEGSLKCHIDPVARLESFRALKLSRLENFLTLKYKTLKERFRALKLSWLENFRALKLSILVKSINERKKQSEHTC